MELSRVKTSFFFMLTSLRLRASKSYRAMTLASRPASSTGAACCCWEKINTSDVSCTLKVFPSRAHRWCTVPRALAGGLIWLLCQTVAILQDAAPEEPIRDLADWKVWAWPIAMQILSEAFSVPRYCSLVGGVIYFSVKIQMDHTCQHFRNQSTRGWPSVVTFSFSGPQLTSFLI